MKSDTSEKGLESLIVAAMTGQPSSEPPPSGEGIGLIRARYGGTGGFSARRKTMTASSASISRNFVPS